MGTVSVSTSEEKIVEPFSSYFSELAELDVKTGESEPLFLKGIRPFLLTNEVNLSGKNMVSKKGRKNKKSRYRDIIKTFTQSNPMPCLKNIIPDNKPYRVVQEFTLIDWFTSSTTVFSGMATAFTIGSLAQFSDWATVFDQYMIDEIEVWLIPHIVSGDDALLYTVVDYDNATAFTSADQPNSYSNVAVSRIQEGHYRRFVPHVAVASYSGTFVSFTNVPATWIDWASPNVQHYGFKVATGAAPNGPDRYDLQVRLHFSNRNVI